MGQPEGGGVRTKKDQSTAVSPGRTRAAKEVPGGEVTAGVGKKRGGALRTVKVVERKSELNGVGPSPTANGSLRLLAAPCGSLRLLAAPCGSLRLLAVSCGFLRFLAVSCGFLRGLFRGGSGLPVTPFSGRALVLNTAPRVRDRGKLSVGLQVRPGVALAQPDEPRPFYSSAPVLPGIMFGSGRSLSTWFENATPRVVWQKARGVKLAALPTPAGVISSGLCFVIKRTN